MTTQRQLAPGATELRRYLEKGLTQAQIAEAWEEDSGIRVSRSTIAMAMNRYGLDSPRPRPRYDDLLPWTVVDEHRMANDARMLRLEGRRRKGGKLTEKDKRILAQWKDALAEAGAVIMYDARTPEGFWWVQRTEGDDDLIRRPA